MIRVSLLPPPPAPLEVAPLDLMEAVCRMSAALWTGSWRPQPRDADYARVLLRVSGRRGMDQEAVNRANGVVVPAWAGAGTRLLQKALNVEASGSGLASEAGRYNRVLGNIAVSAQNHELPNDEHNGPLAFLMRAIRAVSSTVGPLEPRRAWRAYGGTDPTARQADAFEHEHLEAFRECIAAAAAHLDAIHALLAEIKQAPPGPWLDFADAEQQLAALGLPHRGWRQDQRAIWAEGFAMPGARPQRHPRRTYPDYLWVEPTAGAGHDAAEEQLIAERLSADLEAGRWIPTPWEQDRATQLRTFITASRAVPTPSAELLNADMTGDWLLRADTLWRVARECEDLADWWAGSRRPELPLIGAVRAIRRAIPRSVNLAVCNAQLGQQTGLWKTDTESSFPPDLRAIIESAEQTLEAMTAVLERAGGATSPDSQT